MSLQEATFLNEFSEVQVRVLSTRNGQVLQIEAPRLGSSVTLDTFTLELLTEIDLEILSELVQMTYERRATAGQEARS